MGHIAGRGEIKPVQCKDASIKHFPTPKTKKNVRSCLGLIGFYRKFIPNFADIAVPLTDLTKKNVPNKVKWLDIHQESFDKLKGEICKDSVLKKPDFNRKFILQTNASQIGMGAVLQQEFEDGRYPVMFISKRFSGAECNYAVIEKECFPFKMLRVYLKVKSLL